MLQLNALLMLMLTTAACMRAKPAERMFFSNTAKSLHPDILLTLTPYYCSAEASSEGVEVAFFSVSQTKLLNVTLFVSRRTELSFSCRSSYVFH